MHTPVFPILWSCNNIGGQFKSVQSLSGVSVFVSVCQGWDGEKEGPPRCVCLSVCLETDGRCIFSSFHFFIFFPAP